jgi:hypothetical protein
MARIGDTKRTSLKSILEAVLLAAGEPLNLASLAKVLPKKNALQITISAKPWKNWATTMLSEALRSKKFPVDSASRRARTLIPGFRACGKNDHSGIPVPCWKPWR